MIIRKRLIATSVAAIIAAASMCACAGQTTVEETQTQENTPVNEAAEDTNAAQEDTATAEATTEPAEDSSNADESEADNAEATESEEVAAPEADNSTALYNEKLKRIISEEDDVLCEGATEVYSFLQSPGYALYDIDKDGVNELLVTGDMGQEYRSSAVYAIKDGEVVTAGIFNGYKPGDDIYLDGFDFALDAYTYKTGEGFVKVWTIEYPGENEDTATITYEGEETKEISDEEIDTLLADKIIEPEGIDWKELKPDTDLTAAN